MKPKGLAKYYDRLTAEERFRLVLEATAREDLDEIERLAETCPRKVYRMLDADYLDLIDGARHAATCFTILWLNTTRRVRAAEVAKAAFMLAAHAFEQGFGVGLEAQKSLPGKNHPVWKASHKGVERYESLRLKAEERLQEALSYLKGIHQGLLRLCDAISVSPEKLLAVYPPMLEELRAANSILNRDIPLDEQAADTVFDVLSKACRSSD